jgi:hypothetical protein
VVQFDFRSHSRGVGAGTGAARAADDDGGGRILPCDTNLPGHVLQRNLLHGDPILRYRERQYSTVQGKRSQLFPPAGNAADLEGYGFCDVTGGLRYMDYAAYDNDTWNPSTLKQNGNTVTVSRTTADGNWQLTQTILNQPATAANVGGAKITMRLKNLSSTARAVNMVRFATPDDGQIKNIYNTSQYSASGVFEYGIGLSLTVNSFLPNFLQEAYVQNIQSGPDPCNPLEEWEMTLPYNGFGSIAVLWSQGNMTKVAPKATVTVVSTYRGF